MFFTPLCRAEHGSDRAGQAPKGWRHGRRHGLTARMDLSARQGMALPRAGVKRHRGVVFFGSFFWTSKRKNTLLMVKEHPKPHQKKHPYGQHGRPCIPGKFHNEAENKGAKPG